MLWQKNPVTVVGRLPQTWLFAYRTPVATARGLLPARLEPVVFGGWAYWNVVVSRIEAMRPWGLPAFVGVGYWHVAYRLYARFRPSDGEAIEGLYFVRSDCDSPPMTLAGNLLTDFNFHTARVRVREREGVHYLRIDSGEAPARAAWRTAAPAGLAEGSPFGSLDEAAAALKYKPNGLSVGGDGGVNVVRITREETAWRARLVSVEAAHWAFLDRYETHPEICYAVEPIDYRWNRARVYRAGS
jgi:hypothetical protein